MLIEPPAVLNWFSSVIPGELRDYVFKQSTNTCKSVLYSLSLNTPLSRR